MGPCKCLPKKNNVVEQVWTLHFFKVCLQVIVKYNVRTSLLMTHIQNQFSIFDLGGYEC